MLTVEERNEISKKLDELIPKLVEISNMCDDSTKGDVCQAIFEDSGLKDYTEFRLVLEIIKALNKDTQDRVISVKPKEVSKELDNTLFELNTDSCLIALSKNKIPVLVGQAGLGKTYTARRLAGHIIDYKNKVAGYDKYTDVKLFEIDCSHTSYNQFWGSFDAVSHTCIGSFKHIWNLALEDENKNTIFYVVLDELLDMVDIRETFGESFTMLTDKPDNLVIVGTGNSGVSDISRATYSMMKKDDGIRGRFKTIEIKNIMEFDAERSKFFDSLNPKTTTGKRLKDIIIKLDSKVPENLIPREVYNIIMGDYTKDYTDIILKDYSEFFYDIFLVGSRGERKADELKVKLEECGYEFVK
jgi:hypothetical protein